MKKLFYILILFPLLLASCFEDDSNTDIRDINPIVIDLSGGNQLRVKQMDTESGPLGVLQRCARQPACL